MAAALATTPMPLDVRLANRTATWLFALALLAFLVVGMRWFIRLPMFAVRIIEVDGDTAHHDARRIRDQVLPRLEGNVFTVDLQRAQQAFEQVPWVRRAVVQRVWPDRLRVTLENHRPAAWWHQDDGAEQLVDSHGDVFEVDVKEVGDEGLPLLDGPEGTAAKVLAMHAQLGQVFRRLSVKVESLELSTRGDWRVELDNSARVELGRGSDAEVLARTEAFVATLPALIARYQQAPLVYADLRHRDGYAVRLQGVETADASHPLSGSSNAPAAPRAHRQP